MANTKTLPWELDASGYFQGNYTIRRAVLFGTAGSLSIILPVLMLLFLNAQISQHPGPFDQPIDEMMAYTESFLFITASYFSASILVWHSRERLQKYLASWLAIAILGSVIFSVLLVSRLLLSSANTEVKGELGPFFGFIVAVLFVTVICSTAATIACGLASALMRRRKSDEPFHILTRKY